MSWFWSFELRLTKNGRYRFLCKTASLWNFTVDIQQGRERPVSTASSLRSLRLQVSELCGLRSQVSELCGLRVSLSRSNMSEWVHSWGGEGGTWSASVCASVGLLDKTWLIINWIPSVSPEGQGFGSSHCDWMVFICSFIWLMKRRLWPLSPWTFSLCRRTPCSRCVTEDMVDVLFLWQSQMFEEFMKHYHYYYYYLWMKTSHSLQLMSSVGLSLIYYSHFFMTSDDRAYLQLIHHVINDTYKHVFKVPSTPGHMFLKTDIFPV